MKAQRKAQVKPELIVDISNYALRDEKFYKYVKENMEKTPSNPVVTINNIGLSAAKNIKIAYKSNIKEFRKLLAYDSTKIEMRKNKLLCISSSKINTSIFFEIDSQKSVQYIESRSDSIEVAIPEYYKYFLIMYNELPAYKNEKHYQPEIPNLFFNIEYNDLLNNRYRKHFCLISYFSGIEYLEPREFRPKYSFRVRDVRFATIEKIIGIITKIVIKKEM